MRNRKKFITNRNEYDMLCDIQLGLLHGERCVLDALTAETNICSSQVGDDSYKQCCECIQKWLNKEV